MNYVSVVTIERLTNALLALIGGACALRIAWDFMTVCKDESGGIQNAFNKVKNRLFAVIIALCAAGLVAYIREFY